MTKLTNNIFFFLSALGENNNREWFLDHKKDYEQAKNEVDAFFHSVYNKLSEKDHLGPIKIYRIYNDLRRISLLTKHILDFTFLAYNLITVEGITYT